MALRVEELSVRAGVAVDTIRYYQSKGLLEPPRREGRVAWYDDGHLERLARIRSLQQRGYTLATIVRLVNGELDAADEALLGELTGAPPDDPDRATPPASSGPPADGSAGGRAAPGDEPTFTLEGLAAATGIPLALLKAVEAEGLLIPRRLGSDERYTAEDVDASRAALLLLEWGIPLSDLLALARRHHEATEAVARQAVAMFSEHVRGPLRQGRHPRSTDPATGCPDPDDQIAALLQAYADLLPAVTTLVGHHFTRALVKAALDHVEQVGSIEEREAIWEQVEAGSGQGRGAPAVPTTTTAVR
jgi:DNA-binding transcriptional MerR regulator